MDPNVAEKLRLEFPDAEDLAWRRIYAGRTIFYDTKTHRRLPDFNDHQVLTTLMFAMSLTADWGATLKMSIEERKLWSRHFLIGASLLVFSLALLFNCFGDRNQNGIPDLVERITSALVAPIK